MEWPLRRLVIAIGFLFLSINSLNKQLLLLDDQPTNTNNKLTNEMWHLMPLPERAWERMLFGIFTYDNTNEFDLRKAARETHLIYYKYYSENADSIHGERNNIRADTICSLQELLTNSTLARDAESCRIVYTFVTGGGIGNENLKRHAKTMLRDDKDNSNALAFKTRCLYDDPDCGGQDINKWVLSNPQVNISESMASELQEYDDITFLSIPENLELGKTDTWFTYLAILTSQHPELQIGFVGKCDSDNLIRWPIYLDWIERTQKDAIAKYQYIYGGFMVNKYICSGKTWGKVCTKPGFIAERFAPGAFVYISTPLAHHVFMNGTTLERKREVWIIGEDLQLGNMVYSDPNITDNEMDDNGKLYIMDHRRGGNNVNFHPLKTYDDIRNKWYELYPDQKEVNISTNF